MAARQTAQRWLRSRLPGELVGHGGRVPVGAPVVENTPPTLEAFYLGYDYESEITGAELSFSFNDFRYELQGENSQSPFAPFEPFSPSEVPAPSLYLGFDKPLPADLTSAYWDFVRNDAGGGQIRWQSTSPDSWHDLEIRDETDTLRRPGLIQYLPSAGPKCLRNRRSWRAITGRWMYRLSKPPRDSTAATT